MTTIFTGAVFQATNAVGPLSGALLYTYGAGGPADSTNYLATYNAAGLTNTNPVVCNSFGQADVRFTPALSYRVVLKSPTGVTIYDEDAVTIPDGSSYLAALALPSGSSLVNWTQSYTNAVPRLIQDKLRDTVHIKDFGASPSNSASVNNTALQNALTYALANARTTLDLGDSGDYAITGVSIPASSTGLTIRGRGARLVMTNPAPIFNVTNTENTTFDGVRFLGNSGATYTTQSAIYLNGVGRARIVNCHIENFSTGINANNANLGYITGGFQIPTEISGNIIKGCYNGIYTQDDGVSAYGEYCRISNNTITDCLNWGINSHAGNTAIIGNTVNGNYGGILIYSVGTINGDHGCVVNNQINHNLRCGLYVTTLLRSLIVMGNNCFASLGDGTTNGNLGTVNLASSFGAYFQNCVHLTIVGNVFGRNKFNCAWDNVQVSVMNSNVFITDPVNTTFQFRDYSVITGNRYNSFGPNIFDGTWTGGGTNGDPTQRYAPALINSWVNYGGIYAPAAYWRDGNNMVHLSGLIKSGASGTVATVLPIEFRPPTSVQFATISNGAFGTVTIDASGNVTVSGSTLNLSLDGITFPAF